MTIERPKTADEIQAALKEPFDPRVIHWRVGNRTKDRSKGMMLAYIDARDVMKRLDDVLGMEGWSDSYVETAKGRILCELSVCIDGKWVTKSDAAGETQVEGEKGAVSDAFKRAAVKFGVGRYLYYLDSPWVELQNGFPPRDVSQKCMATLPAWAKPKAK